MTMRDTQVKPRDEQVRLARVYAEVFERCASGRRGRQVATERSKIDLNMARLAEIIVRDSLPGARMLTPEQVEAAYLGDEALRRILRTGDVWWEPAGWIEVKQNEHRNGQFYFPAHEPQRDVRHFKADHGVLVVNVKKDERVRYPCGYTAPRKLIIAGWFTRETWCENSKLLTGKRSWDRQGRPLRVLYQYTKGFRPWPEFLELAGRRQQGLAL